MSAKRQASGTALVLGVLVLGLAGCAGGPWVKNCPKAEFPADEVLQLHPDQWPPLEADALFPRVSAGTLAASGFPDHLHSYWWPGWQVRTLPDGTPYGPGAFCKNRQLQDYPGVVLGDSTKSFQNLRVEHHPAYKDCDMLPLLELLHWAREDVGRALGLSSSDTLTVYSPSRVSEYRELTGQDVWRLYQLQDDRCIIEPYGTLQARTLDGHGVFQLMTDWLLRENLGESLPPWLHHGLVAYMAEDGVHLMNYMREFRAEGEVLLPPAIVDALFRRGVVPDRNQDRLDYRRARYNAFLMTWRLVEDNCGLPALRRFLGLVQDGKEPDAAAEAVYGFTLAELALSLDPTRLGEPVTIQERSRKPHIAPTTNATEAAVSPEQ